MASNKTTNLVSHKCAELSVSTVEHNRIIQEAMAQQASTGIAGAQNLKDFAAIKYFALFEKKVKVVHAAVLEIIDSCHTWEQLHKIPVHVDREAQKFVAVIDQKVKNLSGTARHSAEIKDIPALYASLKRDFEFRVGVLIRKKRKDFWLLAILIPVLLVVLSIILGRI